MDGNSEDLLIEILLWLPVVSLLRSKAVCKLWRSIIENSDFIHRHATFEDSSSKLGNFIFQYRPSHIFHRNFKPHFFVLSSSSRGDSQEEEDYGRWSYNNLGMSPHLSVCVVMAYPVPPQAKMVGSCHGIVCIHDPEPRDIILWNPATKKFRCLPKSLPLLDEFGVILTEFVLFGFDCETHDYKVLQITFFDFDRELGITPPKRIQIYSLRSDSWKWCADANLHSHCHKSIVQNQGRYLNGNYYLVGTNIHRDDESFWHCDVVLSFNFSTESFRMIPGPCESFCLDVVGGGDQGKIVCIKRCSSNSTSDVVYEVYGLNDYDYSCGATSADNNEYWWSILHRFTIYHPCGGLGYPPMAITKNGVIGFLCGITGGLVLFVNFRTEMKDIEIIDASLDGLGDIFRGDLYKESLVSIDSAVHSSSQ
ncbi:hypothetical protein MKW94_001450 [Papaver nudicaule]|uniref:F-box domain-containing protein n=1 Tax=Papaver nudicaule TaxID=74823 RepID=A0AA41VRH3_PAPNU|nr:hypothetical protein [Papaver nudicaule]